MKVHCRALLGAVVACAASVALAGEADVLLVSPQAATIGSEAPPRALLDAAGLEAPAVVQPGDAVEWFAWVRVPNDSWGLATVSLDLGQDAANPAPVSLPRGDAAPAGMASFDRPLGISNPGETLAASGFGGTPATDENGFDALVQVGGAQNTFGAAPACLGPAADICIGQQVVPETGVAMTRAGRVVATGRFVAPDVPGRYVFRVRDARLQVIDHPGAPGEATRVRRVDADLGPARFAIDVVSAPPLTGATAQAGSSAGGPLPWLDGSGDFARPRDGQELSYTHVRFWWTAPALPVSGYTLEVARDDGSADPFASTGPLVASVDVGPAEPRTIVKEGFAFDADYAWRVRASTPSGPWYGPVRRFSIDPLPEAVPELRVLARVEGEYQPGLTLFPARSLNDPPSIPVPMLLAVDELGEVVWFRTHPELPGAMANVQQFPDGRLSFIAPRGPGQQGRSALEETLDGRILWRSPFRGELRVHHDNGRMPDGSALVLVFEQYNLPEDEFETRRGDRVVILDRHTGAETWAWRTIDHFALGDGDDPRLFRWTHGNAAHYSPYDNSVYYSSRHMSRITRIDVASGDVVWNMGRSQPSGDATFGDGLFTFQHAPERQPDGAIVLFDNGNLSRPRQSRALELVLDDDDAPTSATIAWQFVCHDEFMLPLFSSFAGDADRLPNGNTLIVAGSSGMIYEVKPDGGLAWWLKNGVGQPVNLTYRAERIAELNLDTPGDSDGDWDIDLMDVARAQLVAARGAGPAAAFPGRLSDSDHDGDVDGADLSHMVYWMTQPVD